uniref:SANT domain-containing protein n=1 Tax=Trichuris muris TaxID=70415 RepID=A0A5S6QJ87_TRIMR
METQAASKSGYSLKCPQKGTSRLGSNYQAVIPSLSPKGASGGGCENRPAEILKIERPAEKDYFSQAEEIEASWTEKEKATFNTLIEKYHKCFREFLPMLPNKSLGDIIVYFYLWKRTEAARRVRWRSARYVTPEEPEKKSEPKECRNCDKLSYQPTSTMVGVLCRTCALSYSLTGCLPVLPAKQEPC